MSKLVWSGRCRRLTPLGVLRTDRPLTDREANRIVTTVETLDVDLDDVMSIDLDADPPFFVFNDPDTWKHAYGTR